MNKSPMRRICEVTDVHPMTLYQRIGVIAKCAAQFAAGFEQALADGKTFPHLHLACDRQDHWFNWGSHPDRRNVVLRAIASAEDKTGYVFAADLNYDAFFVRIDKHLTIDEKKTKLARASANSTASGRAGIWRTFRSLCSSSRRGTHVLTERNRAGTIVGSATHCRT